MMLAQPLEDTLDAGPRATARATERLCAATGAVRPIDDMIRFVLSPEGAAVPDLKRRLPGRGIWITATRAALGNAIARKAFARSFKREVRIAADLVEATERLLERAALDALAIAYKAGRLTTGFAKVEAALAGGNAIALIHAADAAPDGVRKLNSALHRNDDSRAVAIIRAFTSAQLSLAWGGQMWYMLRCAAPAGRLRRVRRASHDLGPGRSRPTARNAREMGTEWLNRLKNLATRN
jgi:predicted RNA-binding protein YlxR (DUF448 family)